MANTERKQHPLLAAVVVMPGPVTGMTLATQWMVRKFEQESDVRLYDLAGKNFHRRFWAIKKWIHTFRSSLWLLAGGGRPCTTVYLAANAQWGLLHTIVHVLVCRLSGKSIILHHHVCSYSNDYSVLMATVQRLMNENDLNLYLGAEQKNGMLEYYRSKAKSRDLPYGYMADPNVRSGRKRDTSQPLVIGHMSNLTIAKGLGTVLEAVEQSIDSGVDVRLILAGPLKGDREIQLVDEMLARFGPRIEYRGPVYGPEKTKFFEAIDCFVFPTRYVNEAQPIVLVEAMSYGLPLIVTDQGCIESLVVATGTPIIKKDEPIVDRCAHYIANFAGDSRYYEQISESIVQGFLDLNKDSIASVIELVDEIDQTVTQSHQSKSTPRNP